MNRKYDLVVIGAGTAADDDMDPALLAFDTAQKAAEACGFHTLHCLTEAVRVEFARYDIDVLLVLPGVVRSDDLNRHLLRNEGKIYLNFDGAQRPEAVGESVVRSLIHNRTETAVGFVSWWVWFGKRAAPRLLRWVMKRKVEKFAVREKMEKTFRQD